MPATSDSRSTTRQGGRMASLRIGEREVLLTEGWGPIDWGCYPMAPFAGRIRDGRFTFRGRDVQLPLNLPPHAIHGTVFERPWEVVSQADDRLVLTIDLGPGWPFGGNVTQSIELGPGGLDATLTLGPTSRCRLRSAGTRGSAAPLARGPTPPRPPQPRSSSSSTPSRCSSVEPTACRPGPSSRPGPRPWDDAFTDVRTSPIVRWPGAIEIALSSTAAVWVVYDERIEGVCVEPQTAPPDAINLAAAAGEEPDVADPEQPMTASMAWRWRDLGGDR